MSVLKPDIMQSLTDRSRAVFRQVVESFLQSGEPVGSRTLTRKLNEKISAATIRNVMQDLEYLGLLDSPHVSAGRIPTQLGLRLFVDGMMEVEDITRDDRMLMDNSLAHGNDGDVAGMLDQAGRLLSGMAHGAGLVLAPKGQSPIKHIEFVSLAPDRALVVLVTSDGQVENRVFVPPVGQTPASLREAANFLNAIAEGHTLPELKSVIEKELTERRQELDALARQLVESGEDLWLEDKGVQSRLIVRGRANLVEGGGDSEELDRIRTLFDDLERKHDLIEFLSLTEQGEGVRVFIGSENKLFSLSGSSLVVSPYVSEDRKIIGAVGVIGPTRLNYGRIVPIVDYTAQLVGRLIAHRK